MARLQTFVDAKGIHMLCDRVLFMGLDADDRIKQVHHDLAINVAGLEPDTGSISTYKISKQLSAFISTWEPSPKLRSRIMQGAGRSMDCIIGVDNGIVAPKEKILPDLI